MYLFAPQKNRFQGAKCHPAIPAISRYWSPHVTGATYVQLQPPGLMEGLLGALRWIGGSREGTVVAAACAKTGGVLPVFNLGFHMFHRITYLGGVGQVVDSCILYHFCIFNLESWGIMIQFHEHICQLGLKPSNFRRF